MSPPRKHDFSAKVAFCGSSGSTTTLINSADRAGVGGGYKILRHLLQKWKGPVKNEIPKT